MIYQLFKAFMVALKSSFFDSDMIIAKDKQNIREICIKLVTQKTQFSYGLMHAQTRLSIFAYLRMPFVVLYLSSSSSIMFPTSCRWAMSALEKTSNLMCMYFDACHL